MLISSPWVNNICILCSFFLINLANWFQEPWFSINLTMFSHFFIISLCRDVIVCHLINLKGLQQNMLRVKFGRNWLSGSRGGDESLSRSNHNNMYRHLLMCTYCKLTFIRDDFILQFTGDEQVRNVYFSRSRFIHIRFDIKSIPQRLVCGEKYSQQKGSRDSHEYFSHAIKSWFSVFSFAN